MPNRISRRSALQRGAAALGGAVAAQTVSTSAQTGNVGGKRFRGWVQRAGDPDKGSLQPLTLLPIGGRQVVVRNQATQCCYSNCSRMLGTADPSGAGGTIPKGTLLVHGHGGVGIVEAIGPDVKRVQVGDRVIVGVTPECGQCYQCLRGRADRCQVLFGGIFGGVPTPSEVFAFATTASGERVVGATNIGGHGEYMVTTEEWCAPVVTNVPAAELAMLHCVGGTGLGMTMTLHPVQPGDDVAVFGCGPIGLSAVQGARIQGAGRIIAVDPVRVRRDAALKLGATEALDPAAEGDNLLERIRALCQGADPRIYTGARSRAGNNRGPDIVVEAVGGERFKPRVEPSPDPTGITPLQQAYNVCAPGGHVMTCGINQTGNVSFPAGNWSNGGKTQHSSQYGGTHLFRDMPRYTRLIERGLYDAKALVSATYPAERTTEAYQAVADRTVIAAVITFNT